MDGREVCGADRIQVLGDVTTLGGPPLPSNAPQHRQGSTSGEGVRVNEPTDQEHLDCQGVLVHLP